MFIIPDVIRGLSHILQFSARGFPREFPYLYKKNKHHKCINPKTNRLRSTNHQSPITNLRLCLFAKKWGLQSKPRLVCLLWGEGKRRYELLQR